MRLSIVLLSILFPLSAYAYFDLGTGSYLFQIVLASFFGMVYTIRSYIAAVFRKIFFRKQIEENKPELNKHPNE